jgi:hypothetical protein
MVAVSDSSKHNGPAVNLNINEGLERRWLANREKQRTISSNQCNLMGATLAAESKSNFANNYIKPLNVFRVGNKIG